MKMKINKACDLSSISVLPPHSRRSSMCSRPESSSIFIRSQGQAQFRSQPQQQSQQSISQGISSQHGFFSQLSQNSQDETLTNDQRFGSQERENSAKRISCLPPVNFTREESQMQPSRSSTNIMHKWGSAVPDQRCQISEQLEHRMGMIETSLSRFAMILDSVQGDIMQVNKGTKEATLEMESIGQKLTAHDNSLQTINKAQEDFIVSLDGGLKSISDQVTQSIHQESLQEISLLLSALPQKIEAFMLKLKNDLSKTFSNDIQTLGCSLKTLIQKNPSSTVLPPKAVSYQATSHNTVTHKNLALQSKFQQGIRVPKVEMGTWNSVKRERAILTDRDSNKGHIQKGTSCTERNSNKGHIQKGTSCTELERVWGSVIESDEEIDGGFSCLLEEKETGGIGNYTVEEATQETERILRKARRRKRKYNTIIID